MVGIPLLVSPLPRSVGGSIGGGVCRLRLRNAKQPQKEARSRRPPQPANPPVPPGLHARRGVRPLRSRPLRTWPNTCDLSFRTPAGGWPRWNSTWGGRDGLGGGGGRNLARREAGRPLLRWAVQGEAKRRQRARRPRPRFWRPGACMLGTARGSSRTRRHRRGSARPPGRRLFCARSLCAVLACPVHGDGAPCPPVCLGSPHPGGHKYQSPIQSVLLGLPLSTIK
jgi:hypothetical protein